MPLDNDIRNYVNRTHANAWRNVKSGSTPDEPALVSSFLSSEMYRALRVILGNYAKPGVSTLIRGIFTHQTPKVKISGAAHSTEIADLMLVHQHFTGPKGKRVATTGNALLFQAKRAPTTSTGSLASTLEALQFQLYQSWAPFESATGRLPKAPPGYTEWDFNLPSAGGCPAKAAAGYLAVFDQQAFSVPAATPQWSAPITPSAPGHALMVTAYPASSTWSVGDAPAAAALPSGGMTCPLDFGTAFEQFLMGVRGRPFVPGVPSPADHWSIFVNHMLRESARSTSYVSKSKNQGITGAPRGRSFMHFAAATALWHAVEEVVDNFLSGTGDHSFDVANKLLRLIEDPSVSEGEGPPPDQPVLAASEEGGHIPVLLVLTVGEEEPFTRASRGQSRS